jgi:DNA mismatch endonuclease (patch repair protein)
MDVLTAEQRSYCMSQIRGKNTNPEQLIRKALFSRGFRYRLHRRDLPGCPDMVLPKHRAAIFIHGCLWHGHQCHLFKWPATNAPFWRRKIKRNRNNDLLALNQLKNADWRVLVIWECALRGRLKLDRAKLFERVADWIRSKRKEAIISARGS